MTTHSPHGSAHAGTNHATPPAPKKNYVPLAIAIIITFAVVVLPQFVNFKSSGIDNSEKSPTRSGQSGFQSPTSKTPIIEKTSYKISTEWTLVNIPYGVERIRFRNATVNYCAKNSAAEHCSNTTEDISGLFGNDKDVRNLQFWIKTKEGEGEIIVELQYY